MTRRQSKAVEASELVPTVIVRVEGLDAPEYWLELQVDPNVTLQRLDGFLRRTWLECCGHLSAFYATARASHQLPKSWSVGEAFEGRRTMYYTYDFGSSTNLKLRLGKRSEPKPAKTIALLARNDPPEFRCEDCGGRATDVCIDCVLARDAFFCPSHAEEHDCGEERLAPVVNSPRVGVCGYGG